MSEGIASSGVIAPRAAMDIVLGLNKKNIVIYIQICIFFSVTTTHKLLLVTFYQNFQSW
jgi:hypothetical protein